MKAYSTSESYGMTAKPSSRYFCVVGQIRRKPWKEKVSFQEALLPFRISLPLVSPSLLCAWSHSSGHGDQAAQPVAIRVCCCLLQCDSQGLESSLVLFTW